MDVQLPDADKAGIAVTPTNTNGESHPEDLNGAPEQAKKRKQDAENDVDVSDWAGYSGVEAFRIGYGYFERAATLVEMSVPQGSLWSRQGENVVQTTAAMVTACWDSRDELIDQIQLCKGGGAGLSFADCLFFSPLLLPVLIGLKDERTRIDMVRGYRALMVPASCAARIEQLVELGSGVRDHFLDAFRCDPYDLRVGDAMKAWEAIADWLMTMARRLNQCAPWPPRE